MTPDDLINEYYSQSKLMRVIKSVYLVINYDKYKLGGEEEYIVWVKFPIQCE